MFVQLDLVNRDNMPGQEECLFAGAVPFPDADIAFADLVSPLVIEPNGAVVPLQHGFPRRFMIGKLGDETLTDAMNRWRRDLLAPFRQVCRRVFEELTLPAELPLVNWYDHVNARAREPLQVS